MSSVLYAKAKEDGELHRLSKKGPGRAARGSVRWTLADTKSPDDGRGSGHEEAARGR